MTPDLWESGTIPASPKVIQLRPRILTLAMLFINLRLLHFRISFCNQPLKSLFPIFFSFYAQSLNHGLTLNLLTLNQGKERKLGNKDSCFLLIKLLFTNIFQEQKTINKAIQIRKFTKRKKDSSGNKLFQSLHKPQTPQRIGIPYLLHSYMNYTANILLVKKAAFPYLLFPILFQCIKGSENNVKLILE